MFYATRVYYNKTDFTVPSKLIVGIVLYASHYNKTDFTVPSKLVYAQVTPSEYYNKTDFTVPSKHYPGSELPWVHYNKTDFTVPSKRKVEFTISVHYYNKTDFTVPSKPIQVGTNSKLHYNKTDFTVPSKPRLALYGVCLKKGTFSPLTKSSFVRILFIGLWLWRGRDWSVPHISESFLLIQTSPPSYSVFMTKLSKFPLSETRENKIKSIGAFLLGEIIAKIGSPYSLLRPIPPHIRPDLQRLAVGQRISAPPF